MTSDAEDAPRLRCFSQTTGGYSLITEPWLPVLTTSGMACRGLDGVFDPDVVAVATGDDLEDTALTRLLLAIHLAADQAGVPTVEWLAAHRADFDLFDPHRPFWQNVDMARFVDLRGAVRPLVSASYRYAGRGSTAVNPFHNECGLVLDAAAAARFVVVRQQFSVGGKQPFTSAAYGADPMAAKTSVATNRPFTWLDDGRLATSLAATAASAAGQPPGRFFFTWPEGALPCDTTEPEGVLDGLTWPSRSMLLVRGDDGPAGIMICDGLRWPEHRDDLVPHTVYARPDATSPYGPQRVHPDRPAWQQLAAMCTDPDYPGVLPIRGTSSPTPFPRWRIGGIGSFQAAISGAITASFPVPVDPSAVRAVLVEMGGTYRRLAGLDASLTHAVSGPGDERSPIVSRVGLHAEFETILVDVARGILTVHDAIGLVTEIRDAVTARTYSSVARSRPLAAARVAARHLAAS